MEDYTKDLSIDKNNLDEECIRNPELYDKWARMEIDASDERDRLKTKIEVVKSRTELELRSLSREEVNKIFGLNLKSLTEASYKALIAIHPNVVDVNDEYAAAKHRAGIYATARKDFEMRKAMLETMAKYYSSGYFSTVESKPLREVKVKKLKKEWKRGYDSRNNNEAD